MLRFVAHLLRDFRNDLTLWRLEWCWKYYPLLHEWREYLSQSAVDLMDYVADRGHRLCDWLVPLRYRR